MQNKNITLDPSGCECDQCMICRKIEALRVEIATTPTAMLGDLQDEMLELLEEMRTA